MLAKAAAIQGPLAWRRMSAANSAPTPKGWVNRSWSPGRKPPLRNRRSRSAKPLTAKPNDKASPSLA